MAVVLADPPGAEGNAEFFLHCHKPAPAGAAPSPVASFSGLVEAAVRAAAERAALV